MDLVKKQDKRDSKVLNKSVTNRLNKKEGQYINSMTSCNTILRLFSVIWTLGCKKIVELILKKQLNLYSKMNFNSLSIEMICTFGVKKMSYCEISTKDKFCSLQHININVAQIFMIVNVYLHTVIAFFGKQLREIKLNSFIITEQR